MKSASRSTVNVDFSPLALLAGALLASSPVLAQDGAGTEDRSGALDEVTITARFREEPLQRTPLAITAVTGESLEVRSAGNVVDIGKLAPNVTVNSLGAGFGPTVVANIRGIGLTDFKPVFEPGVPIYVDDVVLARATGAILDLLDLERVEILRGPQGTLFGKNAAGGAIRLISRKPTGDGPAFIEGTVGNFDRIDVRGSFETALVPDKLMTRFSFSSKKRDGYVDVLDFPCVMAERGTPELAGTLPRETSAAGSGKGCKIDELGNEDVQAGRALLRWVASDRVEFNFAGDVSDDRRKGPADKTLQINPALGLATAFSNNFAAPLFGVRFDERFITNDPFSTYASFEDPIGGLETPNVNNVLHWGLSATADVAVTEGIDVKTILAYREFDAEFGRDSDGSPLPINHTFDRFIHEQWSVETRVSGGLFGDTTDWTVGGFLFRADDFQPNYVILYPGLLPQSNIDRIDDQESDNWAVFLHTVNRLTDQFMLTAGVRYTNDEKVFTVTRQQRPSGTLLFPVTTAETEADRVTPMMSLAYQWTDDLNTYVSWSRGFRGGGFNPRPTTAAQVTSFNPEDLDSYEIGMKSEWFDRRLRLNLAAFHVKYTDMQLPSVFVDSNGSVTFPPLNAGKAGMDGVELEFQTSPLEGLLLDGSVGYLDFEYEDLGRADPAYILQTTGSVANARAAPCIGCRPLRAPEWTGTLGVQYGLPLDGVGQFTLRSDVHYQTRSFFAANNFERASQPGYALVDARLTWDSSDETWSVALSGTNLTDKLYLHGTLDFFESLGQNQGQYGRPREWGLSVKRRF